MINPMNRHSPIRMMGLASGMDTDMIIQQTLRMHQFRIDNRTRDRTILEWRQETHNSIRDEITALQRNFMTASANAMNPLLSRRTFNSTVANINGANSSAVSIRTNTNTPVGSMRIDRIESLAQGASLASRDSVTGVGGSGLTPTNSVGSFRFAGNDRINFQTQMAVPVLNNDGNPVLDGEGNPVTNNVTVTQQAWEEAIAALNSPHADQQRGSAASYATATLNLPIGSDNGPQPQVIRRDNGAIEIVFNGDVLAQIPHDESDEFSSEGFFFPPDVDDPNRTGPFWLERGADGNVTVTNRLEGEGAFSTNLNSLVFSRDMTLSVQTGEEYDGSPIFTDISATVNENFARTQASQALVNGAVPTFSTEFTISNVVNGETRTQTFQVNSNESLTSLMDRVNRSNLGVTMSYNRLTDRFSISSNQVNSSLEDLSIEDGAGGNMLSLFGLTAAYDPANPDETGTVRTEGSLAVAYINGERVERNTNTFQFRGLDITLNSTTEPGSAPIDVNFQRNSDEAFNAIRAFIDAYNTLVSRLETLTSERQSRAQRSYRPLTDEEKQGMTERQVDEWQRVARIGIMRNDNSLERLAFGIRREFFNSIEGMQVDGRPISASQIGLSTGSHRDGTGGQIMIDEERLRAALERDPEMVADIFSRIDVNPETGRNQGVGLIHRLNDRFNDFTRMQTDSLTSLENSLRRTNEQIERMQIRMFAEEDRLFRQFAAMEGAMSGMQNQGQWMTAMLGSM